MSWALLHFHKNEEVNFSICTKVLKIACTSFDHMVYSIYGNVTGSVTDTVTGSVYKDDSKTGSSKLEPTIL